jgi:hypothetical protein
MPHGIMPDSARQEGSDTTYGLINNLRDRGNAWHGIWFQDREGEHVRDAGKFPPADRTQE